MAPTWQMPSGECDGLTTNGVAFMRPSGTFESGVNPGDWREATVMGNVRRLREQRSSRLPGQQVRRGNRSPLPSYTRVCVSRVAPTVHAYTDSLHGSSVIEEAEPVRSGMFQEQAYLVCRTHVGVYTRELGGASVYGR